MTMAPQAAGLGARAERIEPGPIDRLRTYERTVGGETFVIQGEPERRDPDRLVWSLDVRPS